MPPRTNVKCLWLKNFLNEIVQINHIAASLYLASALNQINIVLLFYSPPCRRKFTLPYVTSVSTLPIHLQPTQPHVPFPTTHTTSRDNVILWPGRSTKHDPLTFVLLHFMHLPRIYPKRSSPPPPPNWSTFHGQFNSPSLSQLINALLCPYDNTRTVIVLLNTAISYPPPHWPCLSCTSLPLPIIHLTYRHTTVPHDWWLSLTYVKVLHIHPPNNKLTCSIRHVMIVLLERERLPSRRR